MNSTSTAIFIEKHSERSADKTALIFGDHRWSYAALNAEANRFANWLLKSGIQKGDRVLICDKNRDKVVVAIFGALKAGASIVPIDPSVPTEKLAYIISDCSPAALAVAPQVLDRIQNSAVEHIEPILITDSTADAEVPSSSYPWEALSSYSTMQPDIQVSEHDLASIIYTSGSTKDPRGVVSHHHQVVFATTAINHVLMNDARDIILCGVPLSFDYGLYQIFLTTQVGATLVLEPGFNFPSTIPRLITAHSVTGLPGVPSLFAMLLRSRMLERVTLPSLRYITSTGDVFPPVHIRRLRQLLPHTNVVPMYGLTECKRVSITPLDSLDGHENSVGLPLLGTKVRIVDEDGTEVPSGEVGELVVEGPHVMTGYWRNAEETARRFRVDQLNDELVLYTGDKFWQDTEGYLYFVGRDEMLIKSRGHRISSVEIESFLCALPGVTEAAAVGVYDDILGEAIWFFISAEKEGLNVEAEIRGHCASGLNRTMQPQQIIVSAAPLRKTPNGKIDRVHLRENALRLSRPRSRRVAEKKENSAIDGEDLL